MNVFPSLYISNTKVAAPFWFFLSLKDQKSHFQSNHSVTKMDKTKECKE